MNARKYGGTTISRCEFYWTGPKTNHGAIIEGDNKARKETAVPKKTYFDSTGTFLLLVRDHDTMARDSNHSEKEAH